MSRLGVRISLSFLTFLIFSSINVVAETSAPRLLRASEVMAIQAGGALPENIVHDIATRGLNFHPDDEFLGLMTKAGADAGVIGALKAARVNEEGAPKPDVELLRKLSDAAVLMKRKQYDDAAAKLSEALDASFARMETGFVMAELLQQRVQFARSVAVYAEILEKEPNFPELHDKAGYALYRLGDDESALNEAKAALSDNPQDAEAHMNAGLALSDLRNFDAAILEFKEALKIKPDYAGVHSGIGLLHARMHDDQAAIEEYKKAIALDPDLPTAHNNLGLTYMDMGNYGPAVAEFREARRLCPDNPDFWHNVGAGLMTHEPLMAIKEFRAMEAKFPNFEICHVCLGNALVWSNDLEGAELEFRKAMKLDPSDASPHVGLGNIREKEKNYDAALEEYRVAERLDEDNADAFKGAGKLLLEDKKDYAAAAAELEKAEALEQSNWGLHELYAKALAGNGQVDLAIGEFKEAVALDPNQGQIMSELAVELEKKGDWVGALDEYRKGAVADENRLSKVQPGESAWHYDPSPRKQYTEAKVRFADHLAELRAAGKKDEAAELEKRVAVMDAGGSEKVRETIQAGDQAMQERRTEDAEKAYKQAVELGDKLPPGDESMIVALGRLGSVYGMQHRWDDAQAVFHRQLTIEEKRFGPAYPGLIEPLYHLGSVERERGNYAMAEDYFSRALEVNMKNFGENSLQAADTLRAMGALYERQGMYDKAEPFLLRAVKGSEVVRGPDDNMTMVAVWQLCSLYDHWDKPEKSQPCWHRATGIMEKTEGMNSPALKDSLMSEANALRKLGRNEEALKLEERVVNIQKAAATQ
jgi:tetratricopeptide (TPR) repeat protein